MKAFHVIVDECIEQWESNELLNHTVTLDEFVSASIDAYLRN